MNLDEYERRGRAGYAALAATVTAILKAAIDAEEGYRLHQVTQRAKKVESLRQKLAERRLDPNESIESGWHSEACFRFPARRQVDDVVRAIFVDAQRAEKRRRAPESTVPGRLQDCLLALPPVG